MKHVLSNVFSNMFKSVTDSKSSKYVDTKDDKAKGEKGTQVESKEKKEETNEKQKDTKMNLNFGSFELQQEMQKMIERNRTYADLTKDMKKVSKKDPNAIVKPIKRNFKNPKKNKTSTLIKEKTEKGKELENEMLEEIRVRRKKNKMKKEMKKAKKLEGELKVGNMTVIKDISKLRKCDKKHKNKIYKLPNDMVNKILKGK